MVRFHLLSNAHIDPVWQWRKDEGVGTAISTFSAAADFCEEYDNYVFCHNEAILYEYIERYSPNLFNRIKTLVKTKKWVIIGGWYLQPDCNMPSGESMIRQIKRGLEYFTQKFGEDFIMPKTAVNFDCPGHSVGLIQILNDFGYKYFAYCRWSVDTDRKGFIWKSLRGKLLAYRLPEGYTTPQGKIADAIDYYLKDLPGQQIQLCPWGVGNHGGGASRKDIETIDKLKTEYKDVELIHSTPDAFFYELENSGEKFSEYENLGNVNQGTYSAQYEIKRLYRRLENALFSAEKVSAYCSLYGFDYPSEKLKSAETDMIEVQFHDSLPGTCIREVEDDLISQLRHGIHELYEINTDCLYYLLKGEEKAKDGEYPVFVFNPHPYKVRFPIDCELMLDKQNWDTENIFYPVLFDGDKEIPVQLVKESSSVPLDWRKRIAFTVEIEPFAVKRYGCYFKQSKAVCEDFSGKDLVLTGKNSSAVIDESTGLVKSYKVGGKSYLKERSFSIKIYGNSCDPWGFEFDKYQTLMGEFRLMTKAETKDFLLSSTDVAPINIVEDGAIKSVIEAYFIHGFSRARVVYTMYKEFDFLEINVDLFNSEKDCKVKLTINTPFENGEFIGKTMFYNIELSDDGKEQVAQDNVVISESENALSVINFGNYGLNACKGSIGYTLLTGCGYSAEPIEDRKILRKDRFDYRIDQGERNFRFILEGGSKAEILKDVNKNSQIFHQAPAAINFFPTAEKKPPFGEFSLTGREILLESFRKKKNGEYILRLYNSVRDKTETVLTLSRLNVKERICFDGYEYKTFIVSDGELKQSEKGALVNTERD